MALPIPAWTPGQGRGREDVNAAAAPTCPQSRWSSTAAVRGPVRATARIPRSWSDPKTKLLWKKKPPYEWRWERDRADWGLDYVGEGLTGVRGHNPPRFALTSKPPAACAWDEWGLKPPAEPKSGFCRKFYNFNVAPGRKPKRKKKRSSERR